MSKVHTLSEIAVAISDIERVMEKLDEMIPAMRRTLWLIQEECEMAGTLSAVRPIEEIEADEEHVRALLRSWERKRTACRRKIEELKDERHTLQLRAARAKAAAKRQQDERKARVSG